MKEEIDNENQKDNAVNSLEEKEESKNEKKSTLNYNNNIFNYWRINYYWCCSGGFNLSFYWFYKMCRR